MEKYIVVERTVGEKKTYIPMICNQKSVFDDETGDRGFIQQLDFVGYGAKSLKSTYIKASEIQTESRSVLSFLTLEEAKKMIEIYKEDLANYKLQMEKQCNDSLIKETVTETIIEI